MTENENRDSEHQKIDYVQLILNDIGGTFNKFQIFNYIILSLPFIMTASFIVNYVFTTLDSDYR